MAVAWGVGGWNVLFVMWGWFHVGWWKWGLRVLDLCGGAAGYFVCWCWYFVLFVDLVVVFGVIVCC